MLIKFTIPAVPVAQPRQRHSVVCGHVRNYTPSKHPVNAFKATVAWCARAAYSGPIIDGPIGVYLNFVFPRTKNMIWKTKPMPRVWIPKRPDDDNLEKSVWDALSGVAWRDDCLICRNLTEKCYASGNEQPHVEVIIHTLDTYYSVFDKMELYII